MTNSVGKALHSRIVFANVFVLGVATMGFEMLASRYLSPYFGSGLAAWGALIAVVLAALAAGYYTGGYVADRLSSSLLLQAGIAIAGLYMLVIPLIFDPVALALVSAGHDGPAGALFASCVLTLVPLFLIGLYPPFAIRWLLTSLDKSGRVSGGVYALSTVGNILGTAGTAFFLIPSFGSRALTIAFGVVILGSALSLLALRRPIEATGTP